MTQTFSTGREAKQYLIGGIAGEAQRENVALSELETKMVHFSESVWTLPDIMEINDAFDRQCSHAEYERKIASLIRKLFANDRANDRDAFDTWTEAVRTLSKEDHYLLFMIDAAGARGRPRGDFLKLAAIGLILLSALLAMTLVARR